MAQNGNLINSVQYPMAYTGVITFENLGAGNEVAIDVPPGFVLTGGAVAVDTIFDGTTPALEVADNMSTPNVLLASTALTAETVATFDADELYSYYPAGGRITFTLTGGAGATVGSARVILQGVVMLRQNERSGAP